MSRKRYYNSYGEKLVYDNTVYYGILASADPNAEGYFKQLINFDISDTGQSLTPRKGMINSTPASGNGTLNHVELHPESTVYFKDNTTGKWIFVDFLRSVQAGTYVYSTDLTVNSNDMPNRHIHLIPITKVITTADDAEDIIYLKDFLDSHGGLPISILRPLSVKNAQYVKDNITVDRYVVKVEAVGEDSIVRFWLELTYNDKDNSLIMTVVNTDTVGAVTMSDRNIASSQSLVPNPISVVYTDKNDAMDAGTYYDSFDMIYAKKSDIYLINNTNTLDNLNIVPSYKLIKETGYDWYYTYNIISTSKYTDPNNSVYKSPLFTLNGNEERSEYSQVEIKDLYDHSIRLLAANVRNVTFTGGGASMDNLVQLAYGASPSEIYDSFSINKYIGPDKIIDSSSSTSLSNVLSITVVPKARIERTIAGGATNVTGEDLLINLLTLGRFRSAAVPTDGSNDNNDSNIFMGEPSEFINDTPAHIDYIVGSVLELISQLENKSSVYNTLFDYYIDDMSDISYRYGTAGSNYSNTHDLQLGTTMYTSTEKPVSADKLLGALRSSWHKCVIIRYMHQGYEIPIRNKDADTRIKKSSSGSKSHEYINTLLPGIYNGSGKYKSGGNTYNEDGTAYSDTHICRRYYVYTTLKVRDMTDDDWKVKPYSSLIGRLLYTYTDSNNDTYLYPCLYGYMYQGNISIPTKYTNVQPVTNVFVNLNSMSDYSDQVYPLSNTDGILSLDMNLFKNSKLYTYLNSNNYFDNGISMAMMFIKLPIVNIDSLYKYNYMYYRDYAVNTTTLLQSRIVSLKPNSDNDKTNQIELYDYGNPPRIMNAREWCTFYSIEGYRLVTWTGNFVYMSEANTYHYFKESGKYSYPDRVVKVLPYKDMLLVFTTQDMYSIFPYEYTVQVQDGTNEDGTAKYVQQKMISYNTLPVLYNLHTDDRYKDVIQVYGAFVLFYSTDGQLYLISPSTQIDSDTVFTMKYMNKSANDILLNYDKYINERLDVYGKQHITKNDIIIKSSISVSYIRIFYTVPLRNYTYILSYDIVGNRFTIYDTEAFGTIHDILHSTNSLRDEVYVSNTYKGLSFATVYVDTNDIDNNCDYTTTDNYVYEKKPICTEIDTGMLYLNNQWMKRFRSLRTRYKNLDANELEYKPEFIIDDVFANTSLSDTIELRNVNGTYVTETVSHAAQLLDSNTALFDFSSFNSNKILTHTVTVPAMGKHIELRLRFKSKGRYKLNGFELIYKEHSA